MSDRYFSSRPIPETSDDFLLDGEEAHHLIRVMRVKPGEMLTLFDGGGAEYDAEVLDVEKKTLRVKILARRFEDREWPAEMTLAAAMPKGERQRWLIEKAVELGVSRFVPLVARRSVVKADEGSAERFAKMVVEAAKQSGRNRLMTVSAPITTREFFREPSSSFRILAHPGGESLLTLLPTKTSIIAAVGPEGGFTDEEIADAVNTGWQTISLGKTILRTETAAIKIAAAISTFWE